jgi:hypothetical protein
MIFEPYPEAYDACPTPGSLGVHACDYGEHCRTCGAFEPYPDVQDDFAVEPDTIVENYSDGIPEPLGDGGASEKKPARPPVNSYPVSPLEPTKPYTKGNL